MLLIATTEPSLRTPLYTAENLVFPSKFASEKYCVADSISSMLNLKPLRLSCEDPRPSPSESHPLQYSRLTSGEALLLLNSLPWSLLRRPSDGSQVLPTFCFPRRYLMIITKTVPSIVIVTVTTTAATATFENRVVFAQPPWWLQRGETFADSGF